MNKPFLFLIAALFAVQTFGQGLNGVSRVNAGANVTIVTNGTQVTVSAGTNSGGGGSNSIALPVARTNGGFGFAMSNWVPSGASYDNGSGFLGTPAYAVPVLSNGVYFMYNPGNGVSNDQGVLYQGDLLASISQSGVFIPLTNRIYLFANTPSSTVLTKLQLIGYTNGFDTNAAYADFKGRFTGVIDPTSTVPDGALSANIVFNNHALNLKSTNLDNKIYNTNDINTPGNGGSTLSLIHYGTNGYCDINFYTAPDLANAISSPSLQFALGVGFGASANVAYRNPYVEMYDTAKSFYFVTSGNIHGGAQRLATGLSPSFAWFVHGDTNQPLWRADATSGIVTNFGPLVVQSNVTARQYLGQQSNLGGATAIDWTANTDYFTNLSGNTTFTFVNNSNTMTLNVWITGDASHTVAWTGVKWPGDVAPTQSLNKLDCYTFHQLNGVVRGTYVQGYTP